MLMECRKKWKHCSQGESGEGRGWEEPENQFPKIERPPTQKLILVDRKRKDRNKRSVRVKHKITKTRGKEASQTVGISKSCT